MNAEDYVHRIGRTGRAGRSGRAFTLIATDDDRQYLSANKLIGKSVDVFELEQKPNQKRIKTQTMLANQNAENLAVGKILKVNCQCRLIAPVIALRHPNTSLHSYCLKF